MTNPIADSIARNTARQCKAKDCNSYRYNLSGYCLKHAKTYNLFGNPYGKTIRPSAYKKEYEEALAIISNNIEHTSTQTAIKFIQSWLDKARNGLPCPAATEMARLAYADVTALKILIEAVSMFLFAQRHPNQLSDGLELNYMMGVCILRLSPQVIYTNTSGKTARRKANGTERKSIGKYLRDSLGLYMYNVHNTINRQEKEDFDFRQSLYTPLEIKAPIQE